MNESTPESVEFTNQEKLILASQSEARITMLRDAGLDFEVKAARLDEEALTAGLIARDHGHGVPQSARQIADALAEAKAIKVSLQNPDALVIGGDTVLVLDNGEMLTKATTPPTAAAHMRRLSGERHRLYSAVVAARDGQPLWRHIGEARLWVRALSDAFITGYVERHWDQIRWSVGCYEYERAGVQLFDKTEGDRWTIIGLPMLPLLAWLRLRGSIMS